MTTEDARVGVQQETDSNTAGTVIEPTEMPRRDRLAVDRTMLAHERTFLAYVRTAFALMGGGVAFAYLFEELWVIVFGIICIPFGFALLIKGVVRQRAVRRDDLERL